MTGLYPRTTSCLDNGDSPVSQTKLYPLQRVFQSAGYQTGCFGKLRLRHADGSTTAIWTEKNDTSFRKVEDTALFTNVCVRTVSASEVHP